MTSYHQWVTIDTEDGPMPMYLAVPGGGEPRPAVLVIHGIDGLAGGTTSVADRFADEGYVAAAPDLFHRGPVCCTFEDQFKRRRAHVDSQTTMDLTAAMAHLHAQAYVEAGPTGIIGFCMGGRVAYLMACTNPNIAAAVDCYGGGVFVKEGGPAPIELTAGIKCPVLVLDGDKDHNPTLADLQAIDAELTKHGVEHVMQIYPGIGHGFMGEKPSAERDDAFRKAGDFFHQHLKTTPNTYVETRIAPPTR